MPHTNMEERMIEQAFADIRTACRNMTQAEASALFSRYNVPPMLAAFLAPKVEAEVEEAPAPTPRRRNR